MILSATTMLVFGIIVVRHLHLPWSINLLFCTRQTEWIVAVILTAVVTLKCINIVY